MLSRILVAVDGSENSERAFNTAIEMAKKLEVPLLIVNVLEDFGDAAKVWKKHDSVVKEIEKEHDAFLKKYKQIAEKKLHSAAVETIGAEGDAAEQIRALKQQPGKAILKYGVTSLDQALIANQLIDEFRFWIYPVVAEGTQLFDGIDTSHMQLELISARRYASGVVQVNYRPRWLSSERPGLDSASRVRTRRT
jgi:dihydrofolate reductase